MARCVMRLAFAVRVVDENGDEVDAGGVQGECAIDTRNTKGINEIVDDMVKDFANDIAVNAKRIIKDEHERRKNK